LVTFRDGCSDNLIENSYAEDIDVVIKMKNNQDESDGAEAAGYNNTVRNCIVYGADKIIEESIIEDPDVTEVDMLESTNFKIYNNTFVNVSQRIYEQGDHGYGLGSTILIRNNIFDNCAGTIVGTFNPTFENNTISSSTNLSSYVGSNGNESVDPDFVDAASGDFEPQATFANIDVQRNSNVLYDYNGVEREDPTTRGAVKSMSE
jgi:hypothetical protein